MHNSKLRELGVDHQCVPMLASHSIHQHGLVQTATPLHNFLTQILTVDAVELCVQIELLSRIAVVHALTAYCALAYYTGYLFSVALYD